MIHTEDESVVKETMNYIQNKTEEFNQKNEESYHLSFAMGYSRFDVRNGDVEHFLTEMDQQMYLSKQLYYQNR